MAWKKGQSGNPKGRPKKGQDYVSQLEAALNKAAKKHGGKTLLEHCAEEAYSNPQMAIALLKKFMPDLKQTEIDQIIAGQVHLSTNKKVPEPIQELVDRVIEKRSE
jgi:hypothetical protein